MLTNLSLKIKTQTNIRSPTQGPMHFAKNDYVQVNATEVNLHHKFAFWLSEILGVAIIGTNFVIPS